MSITLAIDGRLCSMYKVTFMGGFRSEGTEYKLVSIPKGGDCEIETPVVEGQFDQAVITLEGIDADGTRLWPADLPGRLM